MVDHVHLVELGISMVEARKEIQTTVVNFANTHIVAESDVLTIPWVNMAAPTVYKPTTQKLIVDILQGCASPVVLSTSGSAAR